MKKLLVLMFVLLAKDSFAKPIRVGILDAGLDPKYTSQLPLCPGLSKDFTGQGLDTDWMGHGTNVAGLVTKFAGQSDKYCIVMYKVIYPGIMLPRYLHAVVSALDDAQKNNIQLLNISLSGRGAYIAERAAIYKSLNAGTSIVVAAGNDSVNLSETCNAYPACYDPRLIVVGNYSIPGTFHPTTNYKGPTKIYELGCTYSSVNGTMCGTSMSAAVVTGKLVHKLIAAGVSQ